MDERPDHQPIIANRIEAGLCVAWWPLALASWLGSFLSVVLLGGLLIALLDVILLLRAIGTRLGVPATDPHLRRWLHGGAQYQGWRVLFGRPSV